MRYYELAYLISSKVNQQELQEIQERVIGKIKELEGILDEENPALKRNLAYEIKGEKAAFLVSLIFFLEPEKISKLKERIEKEDKILRYLIIQKKAPKEKLLEVKRPKKPKKVELEKIEEKLEEILGEKI